MRNRNAQRGRDSEELFCREITKDPQNIREIVEAFSEIVPENLTIQLVQREGQYREKSDVFISTTGDHDFRASIKSFKGTGFNQVTRMRIGNFVDQFDLSDEFRQVLEQSTVRKARYPRTNWIRHQDSRFILSEINSNKAFEILRYSLLGQDSPELFVLIQSDARIISVYKMEELIEFLRKSIDVEITPRGVISLHSCFTIQRKGGNGRHETHAKDDLAHGGNNIQVKIKCQSLAEMLEPITTIQYNDESDSVS